MRFATTIELGTVLEDINIKIPVVFSVEEVMTAPAVRGPRDSFLPLV